MSVWESRAMQHLRRLDLSSCELARQMGVSQSTAWRVINRRHAPSLDFIDRARAVGVEPSWWFEAPLPESEDPGPEAA